MYQVLIADDEPSVSRSLYLSIDWAKYNCKIAGIANNGKEALAIIEKMPIDIAILDIRMPDINGLELCDILNNQYPNIAKIIISGYAEFSYAQKAMIYGVQGYCLKPLDYVEVVKYLLKSIHNLQENPISDNTDKLLDAIESMDSYSIIDILSNEGLTQSSFYIAVSTGEKPFDIVRKNGISIRLGRNQYGYIMGSPLPEDQLNIISREAYILCVSFLPKAVTPKDIISAFDECTNMAYQYFINPNCHINSRTASSSVALILSNAAKICSYGNHNKIIDFLQKIATTNFMSIFDIRSALQLCNTVYSSPIFQDIQSDYYVYSFKQLVSEYGTLDNMLRVLQELIKETQTDISDIDISNNSYLQLMKYIQNNYMNDISLTDVASALHMNPNYVSQMFKRENGVTFTRYITNLRIKEAKDLLQTTDLTISDIAVQVGFNDYFYFLKTFKKLTKKTPSQFRHLVTNEL